MNNFESLEQKIAEQQKGNEGTDIFCVGEQLKDMCRNNPADTELLLRDLDIPDTRIARAVKGIRDYAKNNKKNNFGFCPPAEADKILRKFYGLSEPGSAASPAPTEDINILDFI